MRDASKKSKQVTSSEESGDDDQHQMTAVRLKGCESVGGATPYSKGFSGDGIVIPAAKDGLIASAWVCVHMLRRLSCSLPIQIWHFSPDEISSETKSHLSSLNVECRDVTSVLCDFESWRTVSWELKTYAVLHSPFKRVLCLDADNVPVVNPEFLLDTPQFNETGAIFWPHFGHLRPDSAIWKLCSVPYQDEPEWDTGQLVLDKERCWKALTLTKTYCGRSSQFSRYVSENNELFHMAFRKLRQPVAMPAHPARSVHDVVCQHDFDGRLIFQRRNLRKWRVFGENFQCPGFIRETECLDFLQRLQKLEQTSTRLDLEAKTINERNCIDEIVKRTYEYVRVGSDRRPMTFSINGKIGTGHARYEQYWNLREVAGNMVLAIYGDEGMTCRLTRTDRDCWNGRWLRHERMPVKLVLPSMGFPSFPKRVSGGLPGKETKKIVFRTSLNGYTGYGLHATQIVRDLTSMGYDLHVHAENIDETHAFIPMDVRRRVVQNEARDDSKWELVLFPPPVFVPKKGKRSLLFTMWESTRMASRWIDRMNHAFQLVVPSYWNAACLSANGIDCPINVIPLGINTDIFKFAEMNMEGPCVFGAAGRLESGGMRKGILEVIESFQTAFPGSEDVRLHIKVFSDCKVPSFGDSRIEFTRRHMTEDELAKWFSELTCFVSCSHGEGWGLMQHQALAVGRPLMSALYGGVAEFFTEEMGYPVDFRLAPAEGFYKNAGLWVQYDLSQVKEQMRRVFLDRGEARDKGVNGSRKVSSLSWEKSNTLLLNIMKDIGMVT